MVRGYGFYIIAAGAWMVPEKLDLLRSGLRPLVKYAVWLRCGLRFQVNVKKGKRGACKQKAATVLPNRTAAT